MVKSIFRFVESSEEEQLQEINRWDASLLLFEALAHFIGKVKLNNTFYYIITKLHWHIGFRHDDTAAKETYNLFIFCSL